MKRSVIAVAALALIAGSAAALLVGGDERGRRVVTPEQSAPPATCQAPNGSTPAVSLDPALSQPARVSVPGAQSISAGGLSTGDVAQPPDAPAWVVVRDSLAATSPVGRLARLDAGAVALGPVVDVVAGCTVTALTASATGVWAGTCDQLGGAAGAELLEVAAADGTLGRRISVATGCVAAADATTTDLWAASAASVDAPAEIYRVRADATTAEAVLTLAPEESLLGLAADGDSAWVAVQGLAGARLLRFDATNAVAATIDSDGPNQLLGVVDGTLWAQDLESSSLIGRDASTGAVTQTVPIDGLLSAAVGASGVWYQAASLDATTVTIGRLDASAVPTTVTTYTGSIDRTGAPLTGILSVTNAGAYLSIQDRLFFLA